MLETGDKSNPEIFMFVSAALAELEAVNRRHRLKFKCPSQIKPLPVEN